MILQRSPMPTLVLKRANIVSCFVALSNARAACFCTRTSTLEGSKREYDENLDRKI